ncbi:MAG: molybdopterin oxidoreductase [Capsulimonas sp.]|uniref:molybdopterin oxidoreductase n=1 Tax=Capsulimonas sp. TaxID=2494211 RepID=UPI0032637797
MYSQPRLLQGVYTFQGHGYQNPTLLSSELSYTVPTGKRVQPVYLRAGNSTSAMVYLALMRDGKPMRLFPIGAKGDMHVALAVIEDLTPGTVIELFVAGPEETAGTLVVDLGLVEI